MVAPIAAVDLGIDCEKTGLLAEHPDHAVGNETIAEICDDDDVIVGQVVLQPLAHAASLVLERWRLLEEIDLEQFRQIIVHEASFGDRRCIPEARKYRCDVVLQFLPDKVFVAVRIAQTGYQRRRGDEPRDVIGDGDGPSGELLLTFITYRKRVALAGLSQRRYVVVLIDDCVADHQHLEIGEGTDNAMDFLLGPFLSKAFKKISCFRREYAEMLIQQAAGAEGDFVGVEDFTAMHFNGFLLADDVAGDVVTVRAVFAALGVDTGLNLVQRIYRRYCVVDGDEVNAFEGGQIFSPQVFVKYRTSGALVDILIGRHCYQ